MKHIKLFETFADEYLVPWWERDEESKGKMWKVPLKMPDFLVILKKLGMDEEQLKKWKHMHSLKTFIKDWNNKIHDSIKYVIVQKSEKDYFTWSMCDRWFRNEDNASYKYMGELEATPEEIQEYWDEIDMKNQANKYNI